jgi:hypothetical protein
MSDPLDSYVSQNLSRHHSERKHLQIFNGAEIDTGASKSIIGVKQAKAYCVHKLRMNAQLSSTRFRFADQICSSMGRIKIYIPTPDKSMDVWVDIVQAVVPLLLGLDTMSINGLNVLIATENCSPPCTAGQFHFIEHKNIYCSSGRPLSVLAGTRGRSC